MVEDGKCRTSEDSVDVSFTTIQAVDEQDATAQTMLVYVTGGDDFDDIVPRNRCAWSGRVHLLAAT